MSQSREDAIKVVVNETLDPLWGPEDLAEWTERIAAALDGAHARGHIYYADEVDWDDDVGVLYREREASA